MQSMGDCEHCAVDKTLTDRSLYQFVTTLNRVEEIGWNDLKNVALRAAASLVIDIGRRLVNH